MFRAAVFTIAKHGNNLDVHQRGMDEEDVIHILLLLFSQSVVSDSSNPVKCSTPGFPVLHYLPEFAQTHVHWIRDTIQPSHLLLPPSLPAFNLSQHQGFLQESAFPIRWPVSCSFSFSISPSNEYSEFIPFKIDWFDPLAVQGTLKSLLQYNSSKASVLQHSVLYGPTLTFIYPCWKNHSHTDLCQQSDVSAFQYTV